MQKRVLIGLISASIASPIFAGINGTGGATVVVANPPADIGVGKWESNTEVRAFAERTSFTLPSTITVDRHSPGTSPGALDSNLDTGTIAAGTIVNSYLLHFDIVGAPEGPAGGQATGSISFAEPVLAVIALASSLDASTP